MQRVLCYVRGMLALYKVLDLADQKGMFCGYILAYLGAEVIAVEPPGEWSRSSLQNQSATFQA